MKLYNLLLRLTSGENLPSFANSHGLAALVYDEIVASGKNPLDRRGLMRLAGYERVQTTKYGDQKESIASLAKFYAEHDMRMLVFKGYAMSLLYDRPECRRCGDVDIYLFGDGEKADKAVQKLGIDVLLQVDKHSAFNWKGVHFENHATFVGVRGSKHMQMVERFLENEVTSSCKEDEAIKNVFVPNANFNALFIPLHFAGHWVRSELALRMLYDWAVFLEKCNNEVDWSKVMDIAKEIGFDRFLYAMNYCVVKIFGLDERLIGTNAPDVNLAKEILKDTVSPQKVMEIPEDTGFLKACWLKTIRYVKLNERRKKVRKQSFFNSIYYHTLSYLHYKTNIDKRTIWEMDYMKNNKNEK